MRRVAALQWIGLFVAPTAWWGQHLIGQAIAQAQCSVANTTWHVSNREWQVGLLTGAGLLILASEAAAVAAYRETREADHESPPPLGRIQLISIAAMTANVLFLVIVLLDGIASIIDTACRQS
ncbi:MAG: hypothetical protein ACRDL2_13610 [Gaiellaceae bacterium]